MVKSFIEKYADQPVVKTRLVVSHAGGIIAKQIKDSSGGGGRTHFSTYHSHPSSSQGRKCTW